MIEAAFASGNSDKLAELRAVLADWRIDLLEGYVPPDETGASYYENALIKARYGRGLAAPAFFVIGEDSGIECVALGGEPGLHSARWAAGVDQADALLERLAGVRDRRARMVSELVCLSPTLEEFHTAGVLEGAIAEGRRGEGGFGYDPIFIPAGFDQTVAEIGERWKERNSHRGKAALALILAVEAATSGVEPRGYASEGAVP